MNRNPKSELDTLLSNAQRTVDNVGQWSTSYEGVKIWIGDPGGSRVGKYETRVSYAGRAIEFRSSSYAAITRQNLRKRLKLSVEKYNAPQ
jgi:hypothetical protein